MNTLGISLQILRRFNFVGGVSSVVECQLSNHSEHALESPEIILTSQNGLHSPVRAALPLIQRGDTAHRVLEVLSPRSGNFVWHWEVRNSQQGFSLEGAQQVAVYSEETIRDITLNIDVQSTKDTGEKANMGAVYGDVHIHDLIQQGSISSINDFITKEREGAAWELIELTPRAHPAKPPALPSRASQFAASSQTQQNIHPDDWSRKNSRMGKFLRKLFDDPS